MAGRGNGRAPITDSSLVTFAGPDITDADFSGIMANSLIKNYNTPNATANCDVGIFLMQQCYGGGMLDNLQTSLGTTIPWVFGSASTASEPSYGQYSVTEATNYNATVTANKRVNLAGPYVAATPMDFWTTALLNQFSANPNQTVRLSILNAGNKDAVGPNPAPNAGTFEHPQDASANNGFLFQLNDTRVTQRYDAVLWAGIPDGRRHQNDITGIYNALNASWTPTKLPTTIKVLYGNGTTPAGVPWTNNGSATRTNLVNTMGALPLNGNTMFLFYSSDHGGKIAPVAVAAGPVGPNASVTGSYSLDSSSVQSIDSEADYANYEDPAPGFNPYAPYVEVDYDSLTTSGTAAVYAGSDLLGYLPAGETAMDFNIPYSDIGLNDSIRILNTAGSSFNLDGETFNANDDTLAPVPEPAMTCLLAIGGARSAGLPPQMKLGDSSRLGGHVDSHAVELFRRRGGA